MKDLVWYLVGFLGVGSLLTVVAVWFLGWPFLLTKTGRILAIVGTGGLALVVLLFKQQKIGEERARQKQKEADDAFIAENQKLRERLRDMPDDELDRLLRDSTKPKSKSRS